MTFGIAGRNIVVTGGAGHLGQAFCNVLVSSRANVLCLSSRKPEGEIAYAICDVADTAAVECILKAFTSTHGMLDGFVNCAARAPRGLDPMLKDKFSGAIDGLLTQYATCAQVALQYMKDGGSLVNVASMWGIVAPNPKIYLDLKNEPCLAAPAAAAGILQLTKYLAVLSAPRNIRVNALVPGWFPKKRGSERLDYMREIASRIPMGRIGKPDDLVGPLVFLLSPASSYMTGQNLIIDGGYTIN